VGHVKAHREEGAALGEADLTKIKGNKYADEYAGKASDLHRVVDGDITVIRKTAGRAVAYILALGKVLATWPRNRELYPKLTRAAQGPKVERRSKKLIDGGHSFAWNGSLWVCRKCLRYKRASRSPLDQAPCIEVPKHIRELASDPLGHLLYLTQTENSAHLGIFCRRCGFFSFTNVIGLKKQCINTGEEGQSKGTRYRVKRILQRKHPLKPRVTLTRPWPLQDFDFECPIVVAHPWPVQREVGSPVQQEASTLCEPLPDFQARDEVEPHPFELAEGEEEIDLWRDFLVDDC
jgi:hypothetical protein